LRDRVTVLDPGVDLFAAPVPAGAAMLNGAGECTGLRGCAPSGTPVTGAGLDSYFAVVVEATEEAVLNSMLQAETVSGRSGNISSRLPPTLRTTFTPGARDE
jgi:L-aminopeptidase/D-esterase-like protein